MYTRLRALAHHLNHAKASTATRTMTTVHNSNSACCSIPPVKSDYTPKGTYKSYGGIDKVYVTGEKSDKAYIAVYDIFGFKPQTQQGADILASELKAQVLMPDFFAPAGPWPVDQFPPKTDEEKQKLQEFFGGPASPTDSVAKLKRIAETLKSEGVTKVGAFGYCWGGKVTILAGSGSTPLDAVAAIHPAMLNASDGDKLSVPLGLYPSKDEPTDEYEKLLGVIAKKPFADKNAHKHYKNMFHGWAAARADLDNEENRKEFEDVYCELVKYFQKAL